MKKSEIIDPKSHLDIEEMMDDLILTEGNDFAIAQPVLSDDHWAVYAELKKHLSEDDWVILPGCALSAFFPPKEHSPGGFNTVHLSALIGIGRGKEGQNIKPDLFIMDEKSRKDGSLDFVKTWGIKHLEIDSTTSPSDLIYHILTELHRPIRSYTAPHRESVVINPTEKKISNTIENAPFLKDIACLHEVSFSRIAPDGFKNLVNLSLLGPIDILLHDTGKTNRPVLSIEVDGAYHRENHKIRKDRLKNDALIKIGIPILRIRPNDMYRWQKPFWREDYKFYVRFFQSWVSRIVRSEHEEYSALKVDQEYQRNIIKMKRSIAKVTFNKKFYELTDEQKNTIDNSEGIVELEIDRVYALQVLEGPAEPKSTQTNKLEVPKRLEDYLSQPRMSTCSEGSIKVSGILNFDGRMEEISSPEFFFAHPYSQKIDIEHELTNLAMTFLCRFADGKLQNKVF